MSRIEQLRTRSRSLVRGEPDPNYDPESARKYPDGRSIENRRQNRVVPLVQHGNTTKFTPETRAVIVAALRVGNYRQTACQLAGIPYQTFWRWMHRGEEEGVGEYYDFLNAVMQAEAESESGIVQQVRTQVPKDWRAGIELLQRRHPDRWSVRTEQEISGPGGGPVELKVVYEDEVAPVEAEIVSEEDI